MGKMIDHLAGGRGHQVVARIDAATQSPPFGEMDVAIDFSQPEAAVANIRQCLENGIPVVSGTTGWLEHYEEITDLCRKVDGAFLYASNFSLGMNLFFELNSYLARLMSGIPGYAVQMTEIHHTRKLDAPSGTAISLAEDIIANSDYGRWDASATDPETIPIRSEREGDTPGTHRVVYGSKVDSIEIQHTAHNREALSLSLTIPSLPSPFLFSPLPSLLLFLPSLPFLPLSCSQNKQDGL